MVRSPEEYLSRKVPAQFATDGAFNRDGLKGELTEAGWNIAAASLACDDESLLISRHLEHASMIGQ